MCSIKDYRGVGLRSRRTTVGPLEVAAHESGRPIKKGEIPQYKCPEPGENLMSALPHDDIFARELRIS